MSGLEIGHRYVTTEFEAEGRLHVDVDTGDRVVCLYSVQVAAGDFIKINGKRYVLAEDQS